MKPRNHTGIFIALTLVLLWATSSFFWLQSGLQPSDPLTWLGILLQMHLFTGLFITAHDAMHHTVSANRWWNHGLGRLCATLFMFNGYGNLYKKHHEHHRFVATDHDPDYHPSGRFFVWYFSFLKQYISVRQIIFIALLFNGLKLFFTETSLVLFWIVPSLLSTFQLFYFGTYVPHKGKHDDHTDAYKSRSQKKNHLWAFLSCYFFGYHFEHHRYPATPWWQLHKRKEEQAAA